MFCSIDSCREAVVNKRLRVKQQSADRAKKLHASLNWQQFSRDSDEVSSTCICQQQQQISH